MKFLYSQVIIKARSFRTTNNRFIEMAQIIMGFMWQFSKD